MLPCDNTSASWSVNRWDIRKCGISFPESHSVDTMANRTTTPKVPARQAKPDRDNLGKSDTETLNFKVKSQFKREFKGYAVSRGMTMVELLEASYHLYKEEHSG